MVVEPSLIVDLQAIKELPGVTLPNLDHSIGHFVQSFEVHVPLFHIKRLLAELHNLLPDLVIHAAILLVLVDEEGDGAVDLRALDHLHSLTEQHARALRPRNRCTRVHTEVSHVFLGCTRCVESVLVPL